jgi:hypothetical protein
MSVSYKNAYQISMTRFGREADAESAFMMRQ